MDRGNGLEAVSLEQVEISFTAARRVLSLAEDSRPAFYLDLVRRGDGYCLDARLAGASVATLLCQRQLTEYGLELVVLACVGVPREAPLTPALFDALHRHAAETGCDIVRFHTRRPGLHRQAKRAGYTVSEIVLRKPVEAVH